MTNELKKLNRNLDKIYPSRILNVLFPYNVVSLVFVFALVKGK